MSDVYEGWTVQSGAAFDKPEDVPGTVVTADELPDKEVLAKAGVDVDQLYAGLAIAADEEEKAAILGEDWPVKEPEVVEAPVDEEPEPEPEAPKE